jgi:hypothetical protein
MSRDLDPLDERRLEKRVRTAFASELGRANTDVRDGALAKREAAGGTGTGPVRPGRLRLARQPAALAAIIFIVGALFAVNRGAILGPGTTPAGTSVASPAIPRYDDGIPREWQGQPVLRWSDGLARAKTVTDASPFLLGVWVYTYPPRAVITCPKGDTPDPSWPDSWIDFAHCPAFLIRPNDGDAPINGSNVITFDLMTGLDQLKTGPAILQVHVHDPRAGLCGDKRAICDSMLVVDSALWTGDAVTAPKPLTLADVQAAVATISAADQHPDRIEMPDGSLLNDDVAGLSGARDDYSFMNAGTSPYAMQLMGVSVMQSPADAAKALPHSQPGADGALAPSADWSLETFSGSNWSRDFSVRWLIVENVAVRVRLLPIPSDEDKAFVRQLEAAIRARL